MNATNSVRILVLGASAADAEVAHRALRDTGVEFEALRVQTPEACIQALAEFKPDIVIADCQLPAFDGGLALDLVRLHSEVPVIILSAALGDERAVDLIKAGARDYVLKESMERLGPAVRRALDEEADKRRRQTAEDARLDNLAQIEMLVKAASVGLWNWNLITNEVFFSAEWKAQLGYSNDEIAGRYEEWQNRLHPDDLAPALEAVQAFVTRQRPDYNVEFRMRHKDGLWRWILARASMTCDATGKPLRLMGCHIDITERKRVQEELAQLHAKLLTASREAGMAEIASNVLHHVGNVLNSVNVSATLSIDNIRDLKVPALAKAVALMREHQEDLPAFIANDPKGRNTLPFLHHLSEQLAAQQGATIKELELLRQNIDHIKSIVAMQQRFATTSGTTELVDIRQVVEESLLMNTDSLLRDKVHVVREFETVPPIILNRHKVLETLINLVRSANLACNESGRADKQITVRVSPADGGVKISVTDNGIGIAAENLTRIFSHGFTTRKDGHGFGLHSAALAAKELGGSLIVHSGGLGRGATFTLELPLVPVHANFAR